MSYSLNSTLLLTILLAIGLFFFLRASSKDRTTIVEISSSQQPVKVLVYFLGFYLIKNFSNTYILQNKSKNL